MDKIPAPPRIADPAPAPVEPAKRRPATARSAGYRIRGVQGRLITALGHAIISGRFAPGELLPREADLLAEFAGSRPSLREALKVLAAKGLIEMRQKVGTRVRSRDLWNMFDSDVLAWHISAGGQQSGESVLTDLIELRQVIEPASARFAAGRATMADLRRLRLALKNMAGAVDDLAAYERADVEFHLAVFSASHNALLARFAHLVADFLRLSFSIQQQALNERDNRIEDDVSQHRRVFDAINRGDGDAAAAAMLGVILNGKNSLLAAMADT